MMNGHQGRQPSVFQTGHAHRGGNSDLLERCSFLGIHLRHVIIDHQRAAGRKLSHGELAEFLETIVTGDMLGAFSCPVSSDGKGWTAQLE